MTDAAVRTGLDPLLLEAKRRLVAFYGDRLDRVVLFGSRARGDHSAESDYDVAVFLRGFDRTMTDVNSLSDIGYDLLMETGKEVAMQPFDIGDWKEDSLIMRHIRRDGLSL